MTLDYTIPPFAPNERRVVNGREYIRIVTRWDTRAALIRALQTQVAVDRGVDGIEAPHSHYCIRCPAYDGSPDLRVRSHCEDQCGSRYRAKTNTLPVIVRVDDLPALALLGVLE